MRHLLLLLTCATLASGALAQAPAGHPSATPSAPSAGALRSKAEMDFLSDSVKLTAGDVVFYRVVEDGKELITYNSAGQMVSMPEFTPVYVGTSGEAEVPLIGGVSAAGKTCRQLAYAIKAQLEKSYYKRATVIVLLTTRSPVKKGQDPFPRRLSQPVQWKDFLSAERSVPASP